MQTLYLVLFAGASVFAIYLYIQLKAELRKLNAAAETLEKSSADNVRLQTTNDELAPYRQVRDTEAEIRRLLHEATEASQRMISDATSKSDALVNEAAEQEKQSKLEFKRIQSEAVEEAVGIRQRAQTSATDIVAKAEEEARRIAGEAWDAKEQAEQYTKTAKAMKNVVKGYGDEYLVPNFAALDKLAEDFGHKEAGVRLKETRTATRAMIAGATAAECDYVEAEMREEEKARREIEKAMKEAQKEEMMLEKAMAKARKQLETASEEQRIKYEEQIADLEVKWQEAETKNQRAISMAQQTRRGHVYVISNTGSFGNDVFKIGLTSVDHHIQRGRKAHSWSRSAPSNSPTMYLLRSFCRKVEVAPLTSYLRR